MEKGCGHICMEFDDGGSVQHGSILIAVSMVGLHGGSNHGPDRSHGPRVRDLHDRVCVHQHGVASGKCGLCVGGGVLWG